MKNVINYLENNNIKYESVTYGNPYYYNDGFGVQAISLEFDYELTDNIQELRKKEDAFLNYMKRKKRCCIGHSGISGICIKWYSVFNVNEFQKYEEHETRIRADVEKFWKAEHARRINEGMNMRDVG